MARYDFASDNTASAATEAMEALVQANGAGCTPGYGADPVTAAAADAVRANAALTGADADDALKRLHAAIADIAATTARRAGERRRLISAGTYVVRDGQAVKVERGGGSGSRAVGAGRLTPDEAVAKHRALLKRQHFGREPPRGPSLF